MGGPIRALIEGAPQALVTTPGQTSIGATAALVLAANPERKGLVTAQWLTASPNASVRRRFALLEVG